WAEPHSEARTCRSDRTRCLPPQSRNAAKMAALCLGRADQTELLEEARGDGSRVGLAASSWNVRTSHIDVVNSSALKVGHCDCSLRVLRDGRSDSSFLLVVPRCCR